MKSKVYLGLLLVCIYIRQADAQPGVKCSNKCQKCTGSEYCVVKNVEGCTSGNVYCSTNCLDIDIRKKHCFATALVKDNNCDATCMYCMTQYKCNGAMETAGWCSNNAFRCGYSSKCLSGEAKALCAANSNVDGKHCGENCGSCIGNDFCNVNNSTQCIKPPAFDCADKCLHNSARNKLCFASSMPSASTCSKKECGYCVKQYKCNKRMELLKLCQGGHVDCLNQAVCLDGEAKAKCTLTKDDCKCDFCLSTDGTCKKGSLEERYGYCNQGKLSCDPKICVKRSVQSKQCAAVIGGFCNFHPFAPFGGKVGCIAMIVVLFFFVVGVVYSIKDKATPARPQAAAMEVTSVETSTIYTEKYSRKDRL